MFFEGSCTYKYYILNITLKKWVKHKDNLKKKFIYNTHILFRINVCLNKLISTIINNFKIICVKKSYLNYYDFKITTRNNKLYIINFNI